MSKACETTVYLLSADKLLHKVPRKALKRSKLIEKLIVNLGLEGKFETEPPIVVQVKSYILHMIISWLIHHSDKETLTTDDKSSKFKLDEWDEETFSDLPHETLRDIEDGADLLDIEELEIVIDKILASRRPEDEDPSRYDTIQEIMQKHLEKVSQECICTSKAQELHKIEELSQMLRELDEMDSIHLDIMAELENIRFRAERAQN